MKETGKEKRDDKKLIIPFFNVYSLLSLFREFLGDGLALRVNGDNDELLRSHCHIDCVALGSDNLIA